MLCHLGPGKPGFECLDHGVPKASFTQDPRKNWGMWGRWDPQKSRELMGQRYLLWHGQRKGIGLAQTGRGCEAPGNDDRWRVPSMPEQSSVLCIVPSPSVFPAILKYAQSHVHALLTMEPCCLVSARSASSTQFLEIIIPISWDHGKN